MAHRCFAYGCGVEVPATLLMCARHWSMVPARLRSRIWSVYRRDQEEQRRPSGEWLAAARAARHAVEVAEGRES